MGGSLFQTGPDPLEVPRMPKAMYEVVKNWAQFKIMDHFICIASPIEGPGKKDFGDVDILLAMPTRPFASKEEIYQTLVNCLKPTRTVVDRGEDISLHFAVEFPAARTRRLKEIYEIESEDEEGEDKKSNESSESSNQSSYSSSAYSGGDGVEGPMTFKNRIERNQLLELKQKQPREHAEDQRTSQFVQIDIRLCETTKQFQWMLFNHAHGDMWSILGTVIRPYGLTVDTEALWVRIPEIEAHDRKLAKIRLTDNPEKVLRFLGLRSGVVWENPFKSVDDMFNYITECRFFSTEHFYPSSVYLQQSPSNLKSNDRRRMKQRPAFRQFIEEFLPKCRENKLFEVEPYSREDVKELAFGAFNVKFLYEMRLREFRFARQRDIVMKIIKSEVPEADVNDKMSKFYRAALVKALRRIILDGDHQYGVIVDFEVMDSNGNYNVGLISKFIAKNRILVGRNAMQQSHADYVQFLTRMENEAQADDNDRRRRLQRANARTEQAAEERARNFF
ncbi:hypothetical protein BGZ63DRAFT_402214 [Mariannaea sp. PMI_226]|nr:hypothetical protein BGZ63DRAFT_402214 [Mariannaea sp. PMI_226]